MTSLPWEEIEAEFQARTRRIVFCTVATVDLRGRPRTRILHPIWEGQTGWISTGRQPFLTRHLAANPHMSLCYWDALQQNVHIEVTAEWVEASPKRRRVWELFKSMPSPLGYDIGEYVSDGVESREWGLLKLTPWRIEVAGLADVEAGLPFHRVWRA
jgi:pyridoxine/pyridoxamine 5'-phosphate oxidase